MSRSRARPLWVWLAAFVGAALLEIGHAEAQVQPAPADTLPPDTIVVPIPSDLEEGDTVPTALAAAAESQTPISVVPSFPEPLAAGWSTSRWVITAEELASLPGLTLLEVVERLPGVVGFRAGGFGRPEGLTAMGAGGGRVRVVVDGLEVAPVGVGAFQLETIPLLDVHRVVVDRSLSELRIEIHTFRLEQPDAHSEVVVGTGIYQTRVLRALFSRGFGDRSIGTGGFDLVTTNGSGIREPYSHSTAFFRYGYALTPNSSLQAEWRRMAIDRRGELYPQQTTRRELSLRGRVAPAENLVVEAILARVNQDEEELAAGSYSAQLTEGAVRGAFGSPLLKAEAALRLRGADEVSPPLPSMDAEGRLSFTPMPFLGVEGGARFASGDGTVAAQAELTGVLSPFPGISAFGTLNVGNRLVPLHQASAAGEPLVRGELVSAPAGGWRGGAEVGGTFNLLGAAAFTSAGTLIAPFGLAFDRRLLPTEVGELSGLEAYGRFAVPGTGRMLSLDGWISRISEVGERPYTPDSLGRAGAVFHGVFYGGQLEPLIRLDLFHRGEAIVTPLNDPRTFSVISPAHQTLNLSLQIRILDVEAFLLWDNLLVDRTAIDFPGAPASVPRIVYGAEWSFRG